nr:outer membrane assembly protein AsmA [uncultured Moellerella sp.]
MKRFLTTLAILIVVLVAGLTALVLLVNPNDFRGYLVDKVEQKSGYQLAFQGDMRWHVWPTLSIITGPVSVTAPGAKSPIVSAENMRLDVELWPLISHRLAVEQIVLDGAVVRYTPESQIQKLDKDPIAPGSIANNPQEKSSSQWLLDVEKVEISNSLVIWQTKSDEFNLRDINLSLKKRDNKQLSASFSGNLSKNQQELTFSSQADIDLSQLSQSISGRLSQLDYKFIGVALPENGIEGNIVTDFVFEKTEQPKLSLSNLAITANDSNLSGTIDAVFTEIPNLNINLSSSLLNLDSLFGTPNQKDNAEMAKINSTRIGVKPVISGIEKEKYNLSSLALFTATIQAKIDSLTYRGMKIDNVVFNANNKAPLFTVSQLTGDAFGGKFALPVELNYQNVPAEVKAQPNFKYVELTPLLTAFNLPQKMSGSLSISGSFSGPGYDGDAIKKLWRGNANLRINNARLAGLNIPLLIQQSFSRVTNKVNAPKDTGNYTEVKLFTAQGQLNKGQFNLSSLTATSELINIKGKGWANIAAETLDINLGVQVTKGWGGDSRFIQQLQSLSIPLRLYGSWKDIKYQLDVEKFVRDELKIQAKQAIGDFLKREEKQKLNQLLKAL